MKPNSIMIKTIGKTITVRSPYNPGFVTAARNHGGRWDAGSTVWVFDIRTEERVRASIISIYGTDAVEYQSVTARFDAATWWHKEGTGDDANCYFAGRRIMCRRGRDRAIELGDGVTLVEGTFGNRGGSVRNPSLALDYGTIIEVYDVPAGHQDLADPCVTVVQEDESAPEAPDTQALLIERAAIVARLEEIDAIIDKSMVS